MTSWMSTIFAPILISFSLGVVMHQCLTLRGSASRTALSPLRSPSSRRRGARERRAGGGGWDQGNGVAVLASGSALVTGRFEFTATFGAGEANETTLTSAGSLDIFLARYNP